MVSIERSCHMEYKYEVFNTVNVEIFELGEFSCFDAFVLLAKITPHENKTHMPL